MKSETPWGGTSESETSWGDHAESQPAHAPVESETEHPHEHPSPEPDTSVAEANQQFREFLGLPTEADEEDYQRGHPWGA
jgi:hypothetical protein